MSASATLNSDGSVKITGQPITNIIVQVRIWRMRSSDGSGLTQIATLNFPQGTQSVNYTDSTPDLDTTYNYRLDWYTSSGGLWSQDSVSNVTPAVTGVAGQADWTWANNTATLRYGWSVATASTGSGWVLKGVTVSDTANGVMTTLAAVANPPFPYNATHTLPYHYNDVVTWQFVYSKTGHADVTYTKTLTLSQTPPAPPGPPPNLRITSDPTNLGSVSIAWDASSGTVSWYEISRQRPGDAGPVVLVSSQSLQTYTDNSPGVGRPVTYFVRAYTDDQVGPEFGDYSTVTTSGLPDSVGVLQG